MKQILDIIGAAAFWALFILAWWLYLQVTPNQLSGEADWTAQEAEDAGVEYCPRVQ